MEHCVVIMSEFAFAGVGVVKEHLACRISAFGEGWGSEGGREGGQSVFPPPVFSGKIQWKFRRRATRRMRIICQLGFSALRGK